MKRQDPVLFTAGLPPSVRDALAASGQDAAVVIDLGKARILAATPAGAAAFSLSRRESQAPALDAATPALAALRAIAAAGTADALETLVFWTPHAVLHASARVAIVEDDAGTLAIVTLVPRGASTACAPGEGAANGSRSDHAKLREIARRIRAGQNATEAQGAESGSLMRDAGAPHAPPEDAHLPSGTGSGEASPGVLAHELRTPLNAISAAAEIMAQQTFGALGDARYAGYAADILAGARHMLALIDRMLGPQAHARPSAANGNGAGLTFVELDVRAVLSELASQIAPLAQRAGVLLAVRAPPDLPRLIADVTSLRQMILNLIANALRATPRSGHITLSARVREDQRLVLTVTDTGIGISPRDLVRLREPAARDASATAGGGAGTGGLGLPLVRALASANGAELSLESTPGAGTSASIIFRADRIVPA